MRNFTDAVSQRETVSTATETKLRLRPDVHVVTAKADTPPEQHP